MVEAYAENEAERVAKYRKLEKENIGEIFKKGNKVYVTKELEVYEDAVRYLLLAVDEWGYWVTVEKIEEEDFIIQYLFEKKFADMRAGKIIIKTLITDKILGYLGNCAE